jgi:predicted CoA-substrate-specific enzyme activase
MSRNQKLLGRAIESAEEHGYGLKQCSFLKTIIGGVYQGFMSQPDFVVGSSCFCSGIGSVLHDVAGHFGAPFFYLNLPNHSRGEDAIQYVAEQLRKLTWFLCAKSGAGLEEVEGRRLPEAIERSRQAAGYWKEVEELRKSVPSPMSGREALDFATVLSQAWGSSEIVDIYRLVRDELRARILKGVAAVPGESVRLFWLHLRPYYGNDIMRWIEEAGGAVVFEEVNFPARIKCDPERPYISLAREILLNSGRYRIFDKQWEDDIRYVSREFKIDGVVHFSHDNCGWAESVFPPMYRFLREELKLPVLSLDGDCLVKGRDRLLNTRVVAFLESLNHQKGSARRSRSAAKTNSETGGNGSPYHYVGIDAGSSATKVVVVDSDAEIRGTSTIKAGSSVAKTVTEALEKALSEARVGLDDVDCMVSTGIGRHKVPFEHHKVTELTCHTRGVLSVTPDAGTIIDIGGQDTKTILVEGALHRLNNSCAAGTGRFLEVIAAALGVDLDELQELDRRADGSVPISKMCTVFAESEVVNRIASGSNPGEIARGVHEMVASKAATLLRQLSREIAFPVVFSGGVAMNDGVVKALRSCIGEAVQVPQNPQLMGALGAALLAREKGSNQT